MKIRATPGTANRWELIGGAEGVVLLSVGEIRTPERPIHDRQGKTSYVPAGNASAEIKVRLPSGKIEEHSDVPVEF